MLPTSNFAFLSVHDAQLVQLGALLDRITSSARASSVVPASITDGGIFRPFRD